ncbi:MAG: glycosyltransferase [Alphaproteobacteria bacterium]|nr:glycosyltransferase [Alphaproteobacteria bacterium]
MTVPLTAIMLSLDEAIHIRRAIDSVHRAGGRVFLVDSGSRDDTVAIAESLGAVVANRPWTTYAAQFAWAMQACPLDSPWVCRLDCDEYFTPELAAELRERLPHLDPGIAGLAAKRRLMFQGRWMRHGGLYPAWMVRVWRRGQARIEGVMDEHMIVGGGAIADLAHDFVDDNRKPLEAWLAKHWGYAAREAADVLAGDRGEPAGLEPRARAVRRRKHDLYYRLPPVSRAYAFWLYRYLLRGGFRDGREGWLFHLLQGLWYRTLVDVRIAQEAGHADLEEC